MAGMTTIQGLQAATLPLDPTVVLPVDPASGTSPDTSKVSKADLVAPYVRNVTVTTSTVQLLPTDGVLRINNTSGGAVSVIPPVSPGLNQEVEIKDAGGNAATHNISFQGTYDINQTNQVIISINSGYFKLRFNYDGSIDSAS